MSGIAEFDRVLGGGLVRGMSVLLSGDPGIGKSTLLLQAAASYAALGARVLYVAGEESLDQIKLRATRLGLKDSSLEVVSSTVVDELAALLSSKPFDVLLVDSVQTLSSPLFDSPPGTVAQVRESAYQLTLIAKSSGTSVIMIGHVTKEGLVAGPKVLEHIVDTVLTFEGDQTHLHRILRATKNRFGSTSEIGVFRMTARGLEEVANPSAVFLGQHEKPTPGSAVTAICEGTRTILVEVQALVTSAAYGSPQRVASGIDQRKLSLLLAILEKREGYPLSQQDVFVSVTGGLRLVEPAADAAFATAIISSLTNRPVASRMVVVGELGLSGEMRPVSQLEQRISEAARLGFTSLAVPKQSMEKSGNSTGSVHQVADVAGLMQIVFD